MKKNHISEKILSGAFAVLLEWERTGTNLDESIDRLRAASAEGQSAIASLLFEYFRHKQFIDDLILSRAHKGGVKQELRAMLACALTQSIFQTGIAAQSAANIAVDFAKQKFGHGPASFANAVLRSVLASDAVKNPPDHSFPNTLKVHWNKIFDHQIVESVIAFYASNPPPVFRARKQIPENPAVYRVLPNMDFTLPFQFYEIADPDSFFRSGMLESGEVYIQDPATVLALSLLDEPLHGDILDACAAPGGKTILMSDLAAAQNSVIHLIAADRSPQRLQTLKLNLEHAGVTAETVVTAADRNQFPSNSFDLILTDVPCCNSGVIRRRCDVPWRYSSKRLADTALLQKDILDSTAPLVKPGGYLLYSTCSIEPMEDEQQIRNFLEHHPEFTLKKERKLYPSQYHDGAFGALLLKLK